MQNNHHILQLLPYKKPFLFVDEISHISENEVEGFYTFKKDEYFYEGHFKDLPVTPGVILTECVAQIALVCLGIHLIYFHNQKRDKQEQSPATIAFTESHMFFERPVFPGEKIKVVGRKQFWRMGKLKCETEAFNEKGKRVCYGTLSGIVKRDKYK